MFTAANEPDCLQLTKNDIGKPSWIQNAKIYLWKEDQTVNLCKSRKYVYKTKPDHAPKMFT